MRLGAKGVKAARALGEAEQLTSDAARLGRDAQDVTAAERGAAQLGSSVDTTVPGPYAGRSIPARGPERDWTPQEIQQIDDIGAETGCHTCGTKDPGTKSGHFIPDHQQPSALNPPGEPQRLYPHCLSCSRRQGGQVRVRLAK
jgi:hypothetical protein